MAARDKVTTLILFSISLLSGAHPALAENQMGSALTGAAKQGLSLWELIAGRGWIMIVFGLLSFAVVALVFYYFRTYTVKKLLPEDFIEQLVGYVKAGKTDDAVKLCEKNSNLVADVALAALARKWEGRDVVEQAIKDQGRRSISFLWQQLSYLVDIATIAPMVGLLGTVVGMIEAFNGIAFEMTAVKPILLASGIAKAMIATAAGLFIAIPAMIFYAYFKGKLQKITLEHEHVATELLYLITEREGK